MPGPQIDLTVYESEAALIEGLRRNEPDACTCFVKRFAAPIYRQALRMLGDADDAETALQRTFISACAHLNGYEERGNLSGWLHRIAANEALMLLRKRSSHLDLDDLAETLQPADLPQRLQPWSIDPARATLDAELRTRLEAALAALPNSLRSVFVLREVQGLSTEATAVALSLSESAVKVRLHRARLRLRELLADYLATEVEAGE